jgi:hypothetical protein
VGWDSSVGTATEYVLQGPGIESLEVRFFTPVQTGPGGHPVSSTVGTGFLSELKGSGHGMAFTTHLHLA